LRSRRILITGLSTHWGGRIAQALEHDPSVEAIVGIDTDDPRRELERTEFVRVDIRTPLIRRILGAAAIDTVIDTRLITDPLAAPVARAHEVNVGDTTSLLEACGGPGSPVRKLVFKSSAQYYGSEADDPAFFTEDMAPRHPPRGAIERDVVDAEHALRTFAARNPATAVTVLRVTTEVGAELRGSGLALFGLPIVPAVLGFDPRCQFVHEDDVIGALVHFSHHDLPGAYNVAADGVLALSEVAALLGKPLLPILPPWGTTLAAAGLRRLGLPVPLEALRELRFGRGLDNRRLKAAGYTYRYTTREAVLKLRAGQRLRPLLRSGGDSYRYEREVEEFLRWSPSVRRGPGPGAPGVVGPGPGAPDAVGTGPEPTRPAAAAPDAFDGYDHLPAQEVIGLISSLEPDAAARLRQHEAENLAREEVLEALDRRLSRAGRRT
jgi:UDP-glucose 4-epimerase